MEANRRILGSFGTPTAALEIKTSTLPVPLRLETLCKRYAYRVLQIYLIILLQRTPSTYPATYQSTNLLSSGLTSSNSDSEISCSSRPMRRNYYSFDPQHELYGKVKVDWRTSLSQQAKSSTQLIRVLNSLSHSLPAGQQVEQCQLNLPPPWHINLPPLYRRLLISVNPEDKSTIARPHTSLFNSINNTDNLSLYTDSSKL